MAPVTFRTYWFTFFCWSDLDFDGNHRRIVNHHWKDYAAYCEHIGQEPVEDTKA